MMDEDLQAGDTELDYLFQQYRQACSDPEPSQNFMPALWQKIESRRSLWFYFEKLGRSVLAGSAALCLVLVALNLSTPPEVITSYADAFLPDDSAEQVYSSELVRPSPPAAAAPVDQR